jgi:hypothetical protein
MYVRGRHSEPCAPGDRTTQAAPLLTEDLLPTLRARAEFERPTPHAILLIRLGRQSFGLLAAHGTDFRAASVDRWDEGTGHFPGRKFPLRRTYGQSAVRFPLAA